jgi:hypothetical protein
VPRPVFGVAIYAGGLQVGGPNTRVDGRPIEHLEGDGEVRYRIAALPLLPGAYTLSAAVYDERELHPFDHHHQCYPFRVTSPDGVERYGLIQFAGSWETPGSPQPTALSGKPATMGSQASAPSDPAGRRWPSPARSELTADGR